MKLVRMELLPVSTFLIENIGDRGNLLSNNF